MPNSRALPNSLKSSFSLTKHTALPYRVSMDGNLPQDFSVKRNETYKELTALLLKALEEKKISSEDSEDASRFILERLDNISTDTHLAAFLEEVASRWPCFKPILIQQQHEEVKQEDQQKIEAVENEIENLTQDNQTQ